MARYAPAKVIDGQIFPAARSFGDDQLNRLSPDVLDSHESKSDSGFGDLKFRIAVIHIRSINRDRHRTTFFDILRDLIGRAHHARNQSTHKFQGVISLQVSRFVSDHCIGGRMRLVKPIARKILHEGKDVFGNLGCHTFTSGTCQKALLHRGDFLRLFLTHRPAKHVRFGERKAGQYVANLHHLFLVKDYPVSFLEHRFQQGMQVFCFPLPMTPPNKIFHHAAAQRPRSVQSH